ncbi:MAG: hypothetical protein NXI04_11740 [Planctomycetaceae bacterium]|nr:hypothetical protein [Planctomycetaceae bacterium]
MTLKSALKRLLSQHRPRGRRRTRGLRNAQIVGRVESLESRALLSAVSLRTSADSTSEDGLRLVTVWVETDEPVIGEQTVQLSVAGEGITAEDYSLSDTTITIPDGSQFGSVELSIVDDDVVEAILESMTLTLNGPSAGLELASAETTLTIRDNDTSVVSLADATALEGAGLITFTASLSQPVDTDVTAVFATQDATAADGTHYTGGTQSVTFAAGETQASISVPIFDDNSQNNDRTFDAELLSVEPANAEHIRDVGFSSRSVFQGKLPVGDVIASEITPDSRTVVYLADQNVSGQFELFSVPIEGGTPVRLNDVLIAGGHVSEFAISPDGSAVVFVSGEEANDREELFHVSVNGGPVTRLIPLPEQNHEVESFEITPDSQNVVFLGRELFSVPIAGGDLVTLNGPLVAGGSVTAFEVSQDSGRVVYTADQDWDDRVEIYTVPVNGGHALKLNGPVSTNGNVTDFAISPNGGYAVYVADLEFDRQFELYSSNLSSLEIAKLSEEPTRSSADFFEFQISPDNSVVVFTQDRLYADLLSVSITGGQIKKINGGTNFPRNIQSFAITSDSQRVVYLSDETTRYTFELFSTRITDGGPVTLSGQPESSEDVTTFQLSPDGAQVLYLTRQTYLSQGTSVARDQLFSVPATGSSSAVPLTVLTGETSLVPQFRVTSDWSRVVFILKSGLNRSSELFSVALTDGTVEKLNAVIPQFADITAFDVSANGLHVTYASNAVVQTTHNLYSVNTQTAVVAQLNPELASDSAEPFSLQSVQIVPDGRRLILATWSQLFSYELESGRLTRLTQRGLYGSDQLTPDGSHAVLRGSWPFGPDRLYLVPTAGGPLVTLTPPLQSGEEIAEFRLSPNGEHVTYLLDRYRDQAELFTVRLDGGPVTRLNHDLPNRGNVTAIQRFSPDGRFVIYNAQNSDSRDADELSFIVPLAGGPAVALGFLVPPETSSRIGALSTEPFRFTSDGSAVVYIRQESDSQAMGLYSTSLTTGATIRLDVSDGDNEDVSGFRILGNGDVIYAKTRLYSVSFAGAQSQPLTPAFEGFAVAGLFEVSEDESQIVFSTESADEPGGLYVVAVDDGAARQLASESVVGRDFRQMRFTSDGRSVIVQNDRLIGISIDDQDVTELLSNPNGSNRLSLFELSDDGTRIIIQNQGLLYASAIFGGTLHTAKRETVTSVRQWDFDPVSNSSVYYFTGDQAVNQSLRSGATGTIVDDDSTVPAVTGPFGTLAEPHPTITWRGVANAESYSVSIDSLAEVGFTIQENVTGTKYTPAVPLGIADYRIQVVANFPNGSTSAPQSSQIRIDGTVVLDELSIQGGDTSPEFSWNALPFAARYEIWGNNLTTGEIVIRNTDISSTSFVWPEPLTFGRYRIWMRAFDHAGNATGWSESIDYSLGPQPVAPVAPSFNRRPTFEWSEIPGAHAYELWVATSEGPLNLQGLTGNTWTPTADLPAGSLQWWVRGFTADGAPGKWSSHADADIARPIITGPAGHTSSPSPRFEWTPLDGATSYDLFIYRTDIPGQAYRNRNITTAAVNDILLADGAYQAWVRPTDQAGDPGLWSRPVEFTVSGGVQTTAVRPLNISRELHPTFEWVSIPDALTYDIHLTDGRTTIVESGLQTNQFTPDIDLPLGNWDWWVRATKTDGTVTAWTIRNEFATAVRVVSPAGTIADGAPLITWTPSDASITTAYEVYVDRADDPGFVIQKEVSWQDSFVQMDPLRNGDYRVWVRALGRFRSPFPWSEMATFRVQSGSVTATPTSPLTNSVFGPPTFTWTAPAEASSFDVYVSTGTSFIYERGITSHSWTPIPAQLSTGTQVSWYVRAVAGDGAPGEWSDPTVIDVATTRATVLTTGTFGTDPLPTITWTGIDGVEQYEIELRFSTWLVREYRAVVTGTSVQLERPVRDGSYVIQVRPWRSSTVVGAWSDRVPVTLASSGTLTVDPTPWVSTLDATPLLTWPAVEEAAGYEVMIYNDEQLYHGTGITDNSWTAPANLTAGDWSLSVRVKDGNGNFGSWSARRGRVTIGELRSRFTAPGASASTTPLFEWTAVDGADTYVLYVEDEAGNVIIREDHLTTTSYAVVAPLEVGSYRFWVRAINAADSIIAPWSFPFVTEVS